jgi:hypothetical protein
LPAAKTTSNPLQGDLEWIRRVHWTWLILIPAGIALSILGSLLPWNYEALQHGLEAAAPVILALSIPVLLARALKSHNLACWVVLLVACAFLLRELHDLPWLRWIDIGVYLAVLAAGGIMLIFRHRIAARFQSDPWQATAAMFLFVAYLVALLIDRRVFKFVPGEKVIHSGLEETAETIAHLGMLAFSLVGSWRRGLHKTEPTAPVGR